VRKTAVWLLLACLILAAAAGCKKKSPKIKDKPAIIEEEKTISHDPSNLEEAIQLYENPSSSRDLETAVNTLYQYAYGNDPEAQYYLGLARWEGNGSQQSDLEAYVWWTIAARQHHLEAMNRIEDAEALFTREELDEIANRANDWEEKVRVTPEMSQQRP